MRITQNPNLKTLPITAIKKPSTTTKPPTNHSPQLTNFPINTYTHHLKNSCPILIFLHYHQLENHPITSSKVIDPINFSLIKGCYDPVVKSEG
jgi:hypothetical protein